MFAAGVNQAVSLSARPAATSKAVAVLLACSLHALWPPPTTAAARPLAGRALLPMHFVQGKCSTRYDPNENHVFAGIYEASKDLGDAFCIGGTLGKVPVRLAVAPEGSGETVAAAAAAKIVSLPDPGGHMTRLLDLCAPATFGKGGKTGEIRSLRCTEAGLGCMQRSLNAAPRHEMQYWTRGILPHWRCQQPACSPRILRHATCQACWPQLGACSCRLPGPCRHACMRSTPTPR